MSGRVEIGLLAILFLISFAVRALIAVNYQFDGLYGQDSYAYYDFAQAMVEGRAPDAFFWPLGYPALLAAAFALFGVHAIVGQALNLMLGALLTPLVYILARQMGCRRSGALVAAILMTICGQAVQSSVVLMSDIPALAWAAVSMVAVLHYRQVGKTRWLALSAFALALAGITRWIYLALYLPWLCVLLLTWRERMRRRDLVIAVLIVAVVFVPQALYSRSNPFPVFNHAWVVGWSPGNAFQREFFNADGHFSYATLNAAYYAQPFYDAYFLAPVFTPFLLIGAWSIMMRRQYVPVMVLLGWVLIPYFFLIGIPYQNIRFSLVGFPAVAILAGVGWEVAANWLIGRSIPEERRDKLLRPYIVRMGMIVLVLVGVGMTASVSRVILNAFMFNQQRDKDVVQWARQVIPPGARVYTLGLTLTLKHYTALDVREIYVETPETLAARWVIGGENYLLVNVWDIQHQWVGLSPGIAFDWLLEHPGLTQLAWYRNYTLFKVGG